MTELEGTPTPTVPSLEKEKELEQLNAVIENIDRMLDLARNSVFETALWDPYQKLSSFSNFFYFSQSARMIPKGIDILQEKNLKNRLASLQALNKLVEVRQLALKNYDFNQKLPREDNEKQEDLLKNIYFWAEFAVSKIKNIYFVPEFAVRQIEQNQLDDFDLENAEPELLKEYLRAAQFVIELVTTDHSNLARITCETIQSKLLELKKRKKDSGCESCQPELENLKNKIQELLKSLEMTNVINKEMIGAELSTEEKEMIEEWKQGYGDTFDVLFARASNRSDVFSNICEIKALEKIKPGISKILYKEKGIVNFNRTGRFTEPNIMASLKLYANPDLTSDEETHELMSEKELVRISNYVNTVLHSGSWDTIKKMTLYLLANKKHFDKSINQLSSERKKFFEEVLNEKNVIKALRQRLCIYHDEKDGKQIHYLVPDDSIKKCSEILNMLLNHFNIDFEPLVKSWCSHRTEPMEVGKNISAMEEVEKSRPGAIRTLMKEFGIRNFARYPLDVMIRQFDQREVQSLPYGVILNPTNDYNGSFLADMDLWKKLATDLEKHGYTLRILEAESKSEIGRHLLSLEKRYGAGQKISFAFIGGHGNKEQICFGGYDARHNLKIEDLAGYGAKRSKHFFTPKPSIILASCSTGLAEGIGEKLSEVLGAKVYAPDKPTNLGSIGVTSEENELTFKVEFVDKDSGQTYKKGRAEK